MKSYKIFIVGKITGENFEICKQKFKDAENNLRNIGANPINPFKIGTTRFTPEKDAIAFCHKAIRQCHAIFLLDDHIKSPRAIEEVQLADKLELDMYSDCDASFSQILDVISLRITG